MNKNNKLKDLIAKVLINGGLFLFCISAIYPLVFMLMNSFKTTKEYAQSIFSLPENLNFQNYISAFQDDSFLYALTNSIFNSLVSTIIVIFAGFAVGFFLARYNFRGRLIVYALFFFGLLIPIPALMAPVFLQFKDVGLYNTRFSLLFPYTAFNMSLAVFLFESYIRSIPYQLDESASIDGAGLTRIMYRIIMPICMPIVATVAVLTFLSTWNELVFALTLTREKEYITLPLWLSRFKGERSVDYPKMIAGMFLASLPVILVYLKFNRKVITGLGSGSVKG